LLCWAAVTAYLVFAEWGTWPRLQGGMLIAQRRCMNFADPPGRVVLDMNPSHLPGLSADQGYRVARSWEFVVPGESPPSPSAAASTHAEEVLGDLDAACTCMRRWKALRYGSIPPPFTALDYLDNAPGKSFVLFLHGLHAHGGPERLVVLHADEYFGGAVSLYATVFKPGGLTAEPVTLQARPVGSSARLQVKGLRIFAGKLDLTDASCFTLDYENFAGKGTIEVGLLPDDRTDLRLLSDTAATPPGNPSQR